MSTTMYLAGHASNASTKVHMSSEDGATWTLSSYKPTTSSSPFSVDTDESGQHVMLSTQEKQILLSNDFGTVFTSILTSVNAVGNAVVTTNSYIYFCDTVNIFRGTFASLSFVAIKEMSQSVPVAYRELRW